MFRKYLLFAVIFSAAVTVLPAIPVYFSEREYAAAEESEEVPEKESVKSTEESVYMVLDVSTGKVLEVPVIDYITGAVCAEMPATFEEEALKAQAVAAHTYAERQKLMELENPDPELCGAYFSNDTSKYQGYFTENQAKQYYGENFDIYYPKVRAAAEEVAEYIITYEEEPIISAFHSMSSGKTESAENAWGAAVEYLVPVDSSADTSAPKYLEEVRMNKTVFREKLIASFGNITLGEDFTSWLEIGSISDSGMVLTASAGGRLVSGAEVREALALRSACFELSYEGDEVIITTKGYGHGVGMSQYGANSMAAEGKTWKEIIEHYYPGCEIK